MALIFAPQAAQAHYNETYGGRCVYLSNNFSVLGEARQYHGYSQYYTSTKTNQSSAYLNRNPGYIRNRAEYYADGRYCAYVGERSNSTVTYQLATYINQDIWPWCNNRSGVNVYITMDTWNWAAFGSYWYPNWGGGGIRPITGHCHCP